PVGRLRQPSHLPPGAVRLSRLGYSAAGPAGARGGLAGPARACARARARRARPDPARARHAYTPLLGALARAAAVSLPARARAADARRVPRDRRARRLRGRTLAAGRARSG